MNCAECKNKLDPFGYLSAYVEEEQQSRDFCGIECMNAYRERYPKNSAMWWETYIEEFCDEKGQNCRIGKHLLEKHVPTGKLIDHIQKISRRWQNG